MLYLFDLDGTLITGYMDNPDKNYNDWKPLPGRRGKLREIEQRHSIGVVTNQGGVAWGHITELDFVRKAGEVARLFGWSGAAIYDGGEPVRVGDDSVGVLPIWVCYADARSPNPRYRLDQGRRKPSGAMIHEAADRLRWVLEQVVYVGDRPEDEGAARDAGVTFLWAHEFFDE